MSEMIDRVAEALMDAAQAGMQPFTETAREQMKGRYRMFAHAAIHAMREPSDAVITAGYSGIGVEGVEPTPIWQAMIDEVLREPSHRTGGTIPRG